MATSGWIFKPIGAFVFWAFKGFKTNYSDELSSDNLFRNYFTGMIVFMSIIIAICVIKSFH